MWFGVSLLDKSKLVITNYDINDNFVTYNMCISNECFNMSQYIRIIR